MAMSDRQGFLTKPTERLLYLCNWKKWVVLPCFGFVAFFEALLFGWGEGP